MKNTLPMLVAAALLAAAGTAAPQQPTTPAPAATRPPEPSTERPGLNLQLDDSGPFRPRITFSPGDANQQDAADALPSLGAGASKGFDQPVPSRIPSQSGSSV
ncbi:MAG: hypothetical protein K0R40_1885, partial [Burkholderiales bacterium]|nr:hypothetical protein [Burkholderiales bacterium]